MQPSSSGSFSKIDLGIEEPETQIHSLKIAIITVSAHVNDMLPLNFTEMSRGKQEDIIILQFTGE